MSTYVLPWPQVEHGLGSSRPLSPFRSFPINRALAAKAVRAFCLAVACMLLVPPVLLLAGLFALMLFPAWVLMAPLFAMLWIQAKHD